MPTIKLLYALHCRLNRKANIVAQVTLKSETFQIEKIVMSKVMQNLVILKEQSQYHIDNMLFIILGRQEIWFSTDFVSTKMLLLNYL